MFRPEEKQVLLEKRGVLTDEDKKGVQYSPPRTMVDPFILLSLAPHLNLSEKSKERLYINNEEMIPNTDYNFFKFLTINGRAFVPSSGRTLSGKLPDYMDPEMILATEEMKLVSEENFILNFKLPFNDPEKSRALILETEVQMNRLFEQIRIMKRLHEAEIREKKYSLEEKKRELLEAQKEYIKILLHFLYGKMESIISLDPVLFSFFMRWIYVLEKVRQMEEENQMERLKKKMNIKNLIIPEIMDFSPDEESQLFGKFDTLNIDEKEMEEKLNLIVDTLNVKSDIYQVMELIDIQYETFDYNTSSPYQLTVPSHLPNVRIYTLEEILGNYAP